ncbi:MAG: hypothetical protein JWO30_3399 [Fibrobacteres bacterium]|nr:hypothetical protein [Fibrobacterota bacterium]
MGVSDATGSSPRSDQPGDGIPVLSAYRWLALLPEDLLRACTQSRFQGSGPGGQKRNRVYSGVRLTHPESRLTAESVDSRASLRNLHAALARLRMGMALSASLPGCDPAEAGPSAAQPAFRAGANPDHADFPRFALHALHLLAWHAGQTAPAAAALGCTASALTRFFKSDKGLWARARAIRAANGLHPLK